jgi:hypothetical protein
MNECVCYSMLSVTMPSHDPVFISVLFPFMTKLFPYCVYRCVRACACSMQLAS